MSEHVVRIGANLCVYLPPSRKPIGELHWTFGEGDGFPAGAWVGESVERIEAEGHPYQGRPCFRTRECKTKHEAASILAKRFVDRREGERRIAARRAAWDAFDTDARAELTARVEAEARRIVAKNCRGKRADLGHLTRGRLHLVLRFRRQGYTSGHASGQYKVAITISPTTPWWEVQWLLTHELAHCVKGTSPRGSGRARIVHGPKWQEAFCRIAEKAHGVECWSDCGSTVVWSQSRGVDRVLIDALKDRSAMMVDQEEATP